MSSSPSSPRPDAPTVGAFDDDDDATPVGPERPDPLAEGAQASDEVDVGDEGTGGSPPGPVDDADVPPDGAGVEEQDGPEVGFEGEADALGDTVAGEIRELASQRDSYRDLAQRVQADFENYRKRVQAQIRDEAERATSRLAEALLPVLDATEAAYLRHPDEVGPLLNVLLSELRKQGLEALHLQDQPFDPNVAEAVAHEAGEGGEVVVAEVLRSGYTWNGRTLRPAMVRTRD